LLVANDRTMKHLILFAFVALCAITVNAQDIATTYPTGSNQPTTDTGVVINKDPRIDLLIRKQAQINEETTRNARRYSKGYRLLVANTNDRNEAIDAKNKLYTNFPELKSYLIYQSPYFKLKAGNFKSREEAEEYKKKLQAYFPKGVFIMNDTIEQKIDPDPEFEDFSRN